MTGKKKTSHVTKSVTKNDDDDENVTKFQPRFGIALSDAAATIQVQSDEDGSDDVIVVETENTRDVIGGFGKVFILPTKGFATIQKTETLRR